MIPNEFSLISVSRKTAIFVIGRKNVVSYVKEKAVID